MTRIATWNCGNRSDDQVLGGLHRLAGKCDVMGLQECGDRAKVLNRFCEATGWQCWLGDRPGAPSVPILWNPKVVRALVTGTTPATTATFVGPRGAGPSRMKAKVWNRVRFAADKERLVVINGHIVPSVYLLARRRLAARQITVLAGMVAKRRGRVPVIAVGDFNMKPSDRLTKPLRRLGMKQRTHRPTHGRRCIDHVWTLGVEGRVEVVEMPSDHRAVLFEIKEK